MVETVWNTYLITDLQRVHTHLYVLLKNDGLEQQWAILFSGWVFYWQSQSSRCLCVDVCENELFYETADALLPFLLDTGSEAG